MPGRLLLGFTIALCGALLAVSLKTPLPWMLGALIATAATKISGVPSSCHVAFRCTGQWIIGVGLGLYFTPEVIAQIADNLFLIIIGALFAVVTGLMGSWFIKRMAGVDFSTAYFSSTIGGAAEMANLSDRYGGHVSLVASAHSLRILLVVVLVPLGFRLTSMTGAGVVTPVTSVVHPMGLTILFGLSGAFALLVRRINIPNPWVLGPMVLTIFLTSQEIELSGLPQWFLNGAQLLIGWALGDRYAPGFFRTAPRFMATVVVYTLAAIAIAFGFSWVMAFWTHIPTTTLMLGTAPGGIAEMCITAKILQLGVPLVTAFQVFRLFIVLLVSAPLYRQLLRYFPALRA